MLLTAPGPKFSAPWPMYSEASNGSWNGNPVALGSAFGSTSLAYGTDGLPTKFLAVVLAEAAAFRTFMGVRLRPDTALAKKGALAAPPVLKAGTVPAANSPTVLAMLAMS